jgi:hypothetical protein
MASKTTFTHDSTTAGLANSKDWAIKFTHVPTGNEVWFKAFVTDYNESFESQWNEQRVFGRMDPISTFQGTQRKISLAWDVIASSLEEAKENLYRTSLLTQFLYPVYENRSTSTYSHGTMTAAPLIKVQLSNLISHAGNTDYDTLMCTLSGLQVTPDLESGFLDPDEELYPKLIRLSTQLTVMHTHKLGFDHDHKDWRSGTGDDHSFPWRGDVASSDSSPSTTATTADDDDSSAAAEVQQAAEDAVGGGG